MPKPFLVIGMLFCLASSASAQERDLSNVLRLSAHNGAIIRILTTSGDTLRGRVNLRSDSVVAISARTISLDAISAVQRWSTVGDKLDNGYGIGALVGGAGMCYFAVAGGSKCSIYVVPGAIFGIGIGAFVDAAFGRKAVWKELWQR